jgi:hypothetical protein
MHALIPQSSRFGLAQLLASAAFSGVRTHVRHVFPDLRKSGRSAKDLPARTHQNQSVAGHLQGICCVLQGIARHTRLVSLPFCMLCAGQQDSYRPVRIAMRKNHLSVRQRCRRDCRTADHLISSVFGLVMDLATYRQVRCGPALPVLQSCASRSLDWPVNGIENMSAGAERPSTSQPSGSPDRSLVFIVDDDLSLRDALSSLLRSVGHHVEVFPRRRRC